MTLARHETGRFGTVRALGSQVHPVFMLPPVAASLFGAFLADPFAPVLALLHATAVFLALYTAHVKDGYVDFHWRGEDDDHPLTERGCRVALAGASAGFFAATLAVWVLVDAWAALLTLPGWVIGYNHAPRLDVNPVTATAGYPTGIALALVGGYYVQATALSATVVALAAVFLVVLSGIKVIDDATDYEYDRSIDKRTVAVVLGPRGARRVAFGLMAVGVVGVVALSLVLDGVPRSSILAAAAFAVVAALSRDADPDLATRLLIRGSYVFLAILLAATWLRPFE